MRIPFTICSLLLGASIASGQQEETAHITASDADAGDQFGHSLGLSGDTMVMGAPTDEAWFFFGGSAYVMVRENGSWVQQDKVIGASVDTSDRFGWACDVSGDTMVITSLFGDGASPVSGKAYVFERSGSVWTETQIIEPLDGETSDWFGRSVSIEGDTMVFGIPQDDDNGSDSGSVWVWAYNGLVWIPQGKLLANDGVAGDNFGQSVSLSGDTIVVGAPFDDDSGSSTGSAYVFTRIGTTWTQQSKLTASDGDTGDSFGYSVACDGDRALIGSYRANLSGIGSEAGAGYVYDRVGGLWSETQKLIPATLAGGDDCGWSVALEGDHALLGARGANNDEGTVFHFAHNGVSWAETTALEASNGATGDQFGFSVAIEGGRIASGAYLSDGAGGSSGSAYLFDLFRLDLSPAIPTAGQPLAFAVSGGSPGQQTWTALSTTGAGNFPIPALGVTVDLVAPFPLGSNQAADAQGNATWNVVVPAGATGLNLWAQALQAGQITNLRQATIL